jgi:osmotically-inducible protein OsmY
MKNAIQYRMRVSNVLSITGVYRDKFRRYNDEAYHEMNTLTKKQSRKSVTARIDTAHRARKELNGHVHFRGRVDSFQFEHRDGVLTVRGRVPSFYLRKLLESVLKRVDGVHVVDNQVDVVCCDGLSSVRNRTVDS